MNPPSSHLSEARGGLEAALQGATTAVGPVLLFLGLFGPVALGAGLWASLITATVVPLAGLLFRGHPALPGGSRTASLATYTGLVLQLAWAGSAEAGRSGAAHLSMAQLTQGLAAGSVMFALASVLVWLAGTLRLGHLFKMIPTPVATGISNGTALLLLSLALGQVTQHHILSLVTATTMLGSYLLWSQLQRRSKLASPVPAILVALLLGPLVAAALEPAVTVRLAPALSLQGEWLPSRLWPVLQLRDTYPLLLLALPGAVTLALVMVLETFTAASQMQTRFGLRVDPNRELLALGGANFVSAMLGGVPYAASPLRSIANWQAGGRGVPAAVLCLSISGALLLGLGQWLMAMPAGVAAGLLLLQAVTMVEMSFLRRLWRLGPPRDWRRHAERDLGFWITLTITLIGFFGNLIWACFMGVGLSCLLVLRRVSANLTAHWTYLDQRRSRRIRSAAESDSLNRLRHRVAVLQLTGHLFFGNSMRLMQLADELSPETMVVVLDVSRVHDVDPSGAAAVTWLIRTLSDRRLQLLLSGINVSPSADLRHAVQDLTGVQFCIDLDRALERAEDEVLMNATVQATPLLRTPLADNQLLQGLNPQELTEVLLLGTSREVTRGEALFHHQDVADGVWLLEEGHVSVLTGEDANSPRVATFGPGQFVGEMSLIDGKTRSATALADTPLKAMLLDLDAIAALEQRHPELALKLMRNIARELSNRVRTSTALLTQQSSPLVWSDSTSGARV